MSNLEQTLSIIKPDAVERSLENEIKEMFKNKEKFSGCTVHLVNSKLDSGKIILQKKVKIFKKDTPKSLALRILVQEHALYPKAVKKILANL